MRPSVCQAAGSAPATCVSFFAQRRAASGWPVSHRCSTSAERLFSGEFPRSSWARACRNKKAGGERVSQKPVDLDVMAERECGQNERLDLVYGARSIAELKDQRSDGIELVQAIGPRVVGQVARIVREEANGGIDVRVAQRDSLLIRFGFLLRWSRAFDCRRRRLDRRAAFDVVALNCRVRAPDVCR